MSNYANANAAAYAQFIRHHPGTEEFVAIHQRGVTDEDGTALWHREARDVVSRADRDEQIAQLITPPTGWEPVGAPGGMWAEFRAWIPAHTSDLGHPAMPGFYDLWRARWVPAAEIAEHEQRGEWALPSRAPRLIYPKAS